MRTAQHSNLSFGEKSDEALPTLVVIEGGILTREGRLANAIRVSRKQKRVDSHVSPTFGGMVESPHHINHAGPLVWIFRHALQGDVSQSRGTREREIGVQLRIHELPHLAKLQEGLHQCRCTVRQRSSVGRQQEHWAMTC